MARTFQHSFDSDTSPLSPMALPPKLGLIIVSSWAALAIAAEPTQRLALNYDAAPWQLLPEEVRTTYVGPDGRTWYQLDNSPNQRTRAEIRRSLETEYRQSSPQISGAAIALLEPGGRAWFYVHQAREVWGYDGDTWVETKTAPSARFVGYCPTRGQLPDSFSNRSADGRTWLRDDQGIHIFDGQKWSYQIVCAPLNSSVDVPRLALSPDGKIAVALTPKTAGRGVSFKNPDMWLWDSNRNAWQKLAFTVAESAGAIGTFCVNDDGQVWYVQDGMLRVARPATAIALTDRLPKFIAQLDDDAAPVRQRAYETLAEIADFVQPQVRAALQTAESPEKKRRLQALVEQIRDFETVVDVRPGRGAVLGEYRVQGAKAVFQDERGTLFVFGEVATAGAHSRREGVLIIDSERNGKFIRLGQWSQFVTPSAGRGPIRTEQGDALWMSIAGGRGRSAWRLDLNGLGVTAQSSDSEFYVVRAVDDLGRAFLARREYHPMVNVNFGLGVLSPQVAEQRSLLEVENQPVAWPASVIASDGSLWGVRKEEGLSRFNGKQWETVQSLPKGYVYPVLAGREQVVLGREIQDYYLYRAGKLIGVGPLRRLIAAFQEHFIAGFPPTYTPTQVQYRIWIATDTHKNVWLLENNRVSVFSAGEWVDTFDAVNAAPGIRDGTGPRILSSVGDGSKVFFSSFLAEMTAGSLRLQPAPRADAGMVLPVGLRDGDGALWLPAYLASNPVYSVRDPISIRLGENGPLQEIAKGAWPWLVDQSGDVWLVKESFAAARNEMFIWRKGSIVQETSVPGADRLYGIVSDKPGSVYAWTTLGLQHFAAPAEGGGQYRLAESYALPPLSVFAPHCTYGEKSGLAISTYGQVEMQLSVVHLPP